MGGDQISRERMERDNDTSKIYTISSGWHIILSWVESGVCFELSTILWHFSSVQKFWTTVSLEFYGCLLYFLSFNVLELPEPELTQRRLHQEWQKFAIWFTFVTTKEIAMISVNLGCKVAAASVVAFWRICATRSPFLHPVSIQCHLLG